MLAAANVIAGVSRGDLLAIGLGPWEIAIVVIVILILFGGKKIPELARGIGRGMREFKREMTGIKRDLDEAADAIQREEPDEEDYRPRPRKKLKKAPPAQAAEAAAEEEQGAGEESEQEKAEQPKA